MKGMCLCCMHRQVWSEYHIAHAQANERAASNVQAHKRTHKHVVVWID